MLTSPNYSKDDYTRFMDEGLETDQLEEILCQEGKALISNTGKNNQHLNFHERVLIHYKLIPTIHRSHVTVDRANLLHAMITKIKVDASLLIYNLMMLKVVKPSKALWFLALIRKVGTTAGVKIGKDKKV